MTGNSNKGRKKKTKINPKVFKKVFAFKQNQQCSHSHRVGGASPAAHAPKDKSHAKISTVVRCGSASSDGSSSDDDTSTCSSIIDADGVLVYVTPQRLTMASPPPTAILNRIPGSNHGEIKHHKVDGFLSLGRRRSRSSSALSPAPRARSPYQSKKAQKNLSATLKSCRQKSDGKYSMNNSAWERRQQTSTSRRGAAASFSGPNVKYSRSKGSGITETLQPFSETRDAGSDIVQTASWDSLCLPLEISPAYKFVPIGCDEGYDDCSFDSQDYDICKEPMDEDVDHSAVTATITVNASLVPGSTSKPRTQKDDNPSKHVDQPAPAATFADVRFSAAGSTSKSCVDKCDLPKSRVNKENSSHSSVFESGSSDRDASNNKFPCSLASEQTRSYCGVHKPLAQRGHPPPSPVSTDCNSCESNDLIRGKYSSERQPAPRYQIDRYCAAAEHQDMREWFPSIKQEIMKLSSIFMSTCGGASADT